jgi:hypothetical protein
LASDRGKGNQPWNLSADLKRCRTDLAADVGLWLEKLEIAALRSGVGIIKQPRLERDSLGDLGIVTTIEIELEVRPAKLAEPNDARYPDAGMGAAVMIEIDRSL